MGRNQRIEDQLYHLVCNKSLEKYIIWMKDIWDKLVRTTPGKATVQATLLESMPIASLKL